MSTSIRRSTSQRRSLDDKNRSSSNFRKDIPLPPGLSTPQQSQFRAGVLSQDPNRTEEILQDILKTLEDSTIAEKGEKDIRSRFWATYSKVATEHDDEFLERSHSDMDIVLIFSGLFSAINTAFIIAMQPSSTVILLSQLVQNTSPNTATSALTGQANSTTTTWFQGFAYVALSFSLLAAFGAVLGKQWLSHYKSNDILGSLEDRGQHRQQKLDGLEAWRFHAVMQSFPVLLQISLFLFGIAISAFVWSQQGPLAVTVIVPTVFGILFYTFVVAASLISLQCPFQTPISALIRWLWSHVKTYKNGKDTQPPQDAKPGDAHSVTPSMKWIFKISTDPEVISSVAWLLPTIEWTQDLHMPTVCSRLLSTFRTCFHAGVELSSSGRKRALACGRALHHVTCDERIQARNPSNDMPFDSGALELWPNWQDIALPWGLEESERSFIQYNTTLDDHYEHEARSALRLAIVTGCPGFLKPTDVALIWDGVFDWSDDERTPEDFDWLVDFLVHFRTSGARDFDAMADALLALSAMGEMGSLTKRDNYLDAIIFSMKADKPSRLRHAALRAVCDARVDLVKIANEEQGEFREQLLTELTPALLTTTSRTTLVTPQLKDDPDALFNPGREYFYLRLIFTLATQSDWQAQLGKTGHIDRCVSLLEHVTNSSHSTGPWEPARNHPFYLAGALIRMNASESYQSSDLADKTSELEWWNLLKGAWLAMWWNNLYDEEEALEALPGLVKYTLESLETQPAIYDSKSLVRSVDRIYEALDGVAGSDITSAVKSVKDALGRIGSDERTQCNSAGNGSVPNAGIITSPSPALPPSLDGICTFPTVS